MQTAMTVAASRDVTSPMTADVIRAHVNRVQEVMRAVMKPNVHYGTIPGAGDKPALFKPGAEVLCLTFRIAPSFRIDDLSDSDAIRYRVTCVGVHQTTGDTLGEGVGEASTDEEKYRWRAAVCLEEFNATPEDRRRVKYGKQSRTNGGGFYTVNQVRTNKSDVGNTVLKMACKRALVAMTLNVCAASDCFAQDIEDLPAELRDGEGDGQEQQSQPRGRRPTTQAPRAKAQAQQQQQQQQPASQQSPPPQASGEQQKGPPQIATEAQCHLIRKRLDNAGVGENAFLDAFQIEKVESLPFPKVNDALDWIAQRTP